MQSKISIRRLARVALLALLAQAPVAADELRYVITGIGDPLVGNVRQHLERFGLTETQQISARNFDELSAEAEQRVRAALKPYGYYDPEVSTSLSQLDADTWRMRIQVARGEPVRVAQASVHVLGEGSDDPELREWRRNWPLTVGSVLDQPRWEAEKNAALSIAEARGFLDARFTAQRIAVDVDENSAHLTLVLDSGPRAVFGDVRFEQDLVRPWVLEKIPRFEHGTPYNADLLEQFRLDLWRTGYFTDIEVREARLPERSPPVVDLEVDVDSDYSDTWQGNVGFGNDTGIRLQGVWSRHLLSARGDRVDVGAGYRAVDDEFSARADYRIPRRTGERQFWVTSLGIRADKQDLEFKRNVDDEGFIKLASGQVDNIDARFGRLHVRDRKQGLQQILETIYLQATRGSFDYLPGVDAAPEVRALAEDPRFAGLFRNTINTLSVGIEWDWPALEGSGFVTEGHRERAWLFTANEAWGSERDFTQVYLSTRRSYVYFDRLKFLLRAEVGYTDADVRELSGTADGLPFTLSVTQLPDTYRFKAGGSSSVRGYGFEELSDNDIGSNHVITASAEVEYRLLDKWSVAAFADIGNAFNDWDERNLRKGVGIGVRWYTVAGAIRVDLARGVDVEGRPWRIHFTVGSPLL